jgi:hypothetical protein
MIQYRGVTKPGGGKPRHYISCPRPTSVQGQQFTNPEYNEQTGSER